MLQNTEVHNIWVVVYCICIGSVMVCDWHMYFVQLCRIHLLVAFISMCMPRFFLLKVRSIRSCQVIVIIIIVKHFANREAFFCTWPGMLMSYQRRWRCHPPHPHPSTENRRNNSRNSSTKCLGRLVWHVDWVRQCGLGRLCETSWVVKKRVWFSGKDAGV